MREPWGSYRVPEDCARRSASVLKKKKRTKAKADHTDPSLSRKVVLLALLSSLLGMNTLGVRQESLRSERKGRQVKGTREIG